MSRYIKKIKKIPKRIVREVEKRKYKRNAFAGYLKILNVEESLQYLEKNTISFYRYGDGEIAIMLGDSIPFQKYDEKLAKRLKELLTPYAENVKAAIPYYYFNYENNLIPMIEGFAYAMKKQRRFLMKYCSRSEIYLDTSISQIYQSYETYDFDSYFSRVENLFAGRDVTLISGGNVLKHLQYNLLDKSNSIEYIIAPDRDAYDEYGLLLSKALRTPRERLVCIVLGPAAKPLAYDLARNGYQAWDIGHFLKDYDAYRKKSVRNEESITNFYKPD